MLNPEVLEQGIPDDAFMAVTGDDKKVATFFKKRNKQERTSPQRGFTFEADDHGGEYAASNRELRELSENTAADVRKKAQMYSSWRAGMQHSHDEAVADLWTAQFFLPLTSTTDPAICTTKDFLEFAVALAKYAGRFERRNLTSPPTARRWRKRPPWPRRSPTESGQGEAENSSGERRSLEPITLHACFPSPAHLGVAEPAGGGAAAIKKTFAHHLRGKYPKIACH